MSKRYLNYPTILISMLLTYSTSRIFGLLSYQTFVSILLSYCAILDLNRFKINNLALIGLILITLLNFKYTLTFDLYINIGIVVMITLINKLNPFLARGDILLLYTVTGLNKVNMMGMLIALTVVGVMIIQRKYRVAKIPVMPIILFSQTVAMVLFPWINTL